MKQEVFQVFVGAFAECRERFHELRHSRRFKALAQGHSKQQVEPCSSEMLTPVVMTKPVLS